MSPEPPPLEGGRVLADRFEVQRVLGRGGFGIAYLARDRTREDQVVVKELAPVGVPRSRDGVLDLDRSGTPGNILRQRFLHEAELLRVIHHPGVPALRMAFAENGTAYHVTGYVAGAQTLEHRLQRSGLMPEADAREIFVSIMDVLERVHALGILHRDIKPSNVLLGPHGEVLLIDFGAAREWVEGAPVTHTVMHTPGYAPPEQLSERAPRGPYTDLYGLCATTYHMLTGQAPATANDRLAGVDLTPIMAVRPSVDPAFARAVEAGLAVRPSDRPADVDELRILLAAEEEVDTGLTLEKVVDTLSRLQVFHYERRACPACQGVLVDTRPLRKGACPVCLNGTIKRWSFEENRCPVCRSGRLQTLRNDGPLTICPTCSVGRLEYRRRRLLSGPQEANCPECGAHFDLHDTGMASGGESASFEEWRLRSERGPQVRWCEGCDAQFDRMPDGRWSQVEPSSPVLRAYYSDEWARIASGQDPGAGNGACDTCGADFWMEDDRLTLLDAPVDPQGYAGSYTGRALHVDDVRWLAVGKESGQPGLVCEDCPTELDRDGDYYRLVRSPSRYLSAHLGEPKTLEDWHRIAQQLPTVDGEEEYVGLLEPLLRAAYHKGVVSFDDSGMLWRGEAVRQSDQSRAVLEVRQGELVFGGIFRRWRIPLDAVVRVAARSDILELTVSGHASPERFDLHPIHLTVHLSCGDQDLDLTAEDLAKRMAGLRG